MKKSEAKLKLSETQKGVIAKMREGARLASIDCTLYLFHSGGHEKFNHSVSGRLISLQLMRYQPKSNYIELTDLGKTTQL